MSERVQTPIKSFVRPSAARADGKTVIRDLRNYLAGQVVGITRDEGLLDEVLKCAFCKVQLERGGTPTDGLGAEQVAALYGAAHDELRQRLYLLDLGADLQLGPQHIERVDQALDRLGLLDPARDVVGDLYEAFAGPSIKGQEGQFFTPKNAVQALVAIVGPRADDTLIDPACGAGAFLMEAARYSLNVDGALPTLSGIDKDAFLARLARIHLALQFDVEPQVTCANSLSSFDVLLSAAGYGQEAHTVLLTNPPFGSKIVAVAGDDRNNFALAHKWRQVEGRYEQTEVLSSNTPPQVLFVERCLDLLAEGGRLGLVLPESVLSNSSHRYMVQYLLERATPTAVIGMPEALFKTSGKGGTHTKVCLAVFEKRPPSQSDNIFMAEARWCGHDSRGLPIERDDLPEIVEKYEAVGQGETLPETRTGFLLPVRHLRSFVLAPRYYDPEPRQQLAVLRRTHDEIKIGDLIEEGALQVATGTEVGKLAYGGGDVPFVRTSDISNWEIKVDPKHTVSEDLYASLAARQDVQAGDILMVRDGTYLIGTCAMVTEHDVRMVYQSHLYKLRACPASPIDEFLLLALLSSPPLRSQIRANSFTLDIIDSLGDRLRDLVLPVPKSSAKRTQISAMVKRVIDDRVEARELARRAALEVAAEF